MHIKLDKGKPSTYDHRLRRIGHPVRSAIHKPQIGRLVVKWVTISEYLLLYVLFLAFFVLLKNRPFFWPLDSLVLWQVKKEYLDRSKKVFCSRSEG
jgi:hypothetical protein